MGKCVADAALGARVSISGVWNGAVDVRCSTRCGEQIAQAMFRRPAATLTELDIIDGLKEGTNMIAGNIKVYLPELSDSDACCLTVPEVLDPLENGGHSTVLPLVEKRFECGGEFLGVSVCLSGDAGANLVKPAQQSAHSS